MLLSSIAQGVLIFSLCACTTHKKHTKKLVPIDIERTDIIEIPVEVAEYSQKFSIKLPKYSEIKSSDPALDFSQDISSTDESQNDKTQKTHDEWMSGIKSYEHEVRDHAAGSKSTSVTFDITSIPIGISYHIDLDKPRKKAKNGSYPQISK